MNKSNLIGRF